MPVDVRGAEMDEALHRGVDGSGEQAPRALDIYAPDLLDRGPVRDERAAVHHGAAALRGAPERRSARQIADDELDIEFAQRRVVAARAHETTHAVPSPGQPLHQAPADESGRPGDQD